MIKKTLVIIFILIFSHSAFPDKHKTIMKKHNDMIFIFHPVKIKGVIKNMRYFYIYNVKFMMINSKSVGFKKIEILLPEKTIMPFEMNKTLYLHKGRFIFNMPVEKKSRIEFKSFKIRLYLMLKNDKKNLKATSGVEKKQKPTTDKNTKELKIKIIEYIIKKSDFEKN